MIATAETLAPAWAIRARALFAVCALVVVSAAGCGGGVCVVPESGVEALVLLDGVWEVTAYDGREDGEITFDGPELTTTWDNVTLGGTWEHIASVDNAHTVRLTIDEAWENGAQQRFGTLDELDVELVFAGHDHLFALQSDGAWTEWRRVMPVAPISSP